MLTKENEIQADVVLGLVYGDEAKMKIAGHLIKNGQYTHTMRTSGGENAGHTIYLDGKKVVTHMVPVGALFGIPSIVGSRCVVNVKSFSKELADLAGFCPGASEYVKIAYNTHIVKDEHIEEELRESKIGTTRKGIGPAYRDKYARTGIRAEDIPEFKDICVDLYDELSANGAEVLCEGAQGTWLDIDLGDYPYVTSSNCGVGAIINNGIPHKSIRKVYGACKCYDTYVGARKFQDESDETLRKIGEVGAEYGATTGRLRQVNYLNLRKLKKAAVLNGVDQIVMSKMDILREINVWKVIEGNGDKISFDSEESF